MLTRRDALVAAAAAVVTIGTSRPSWPAAPQTHDGSPARPGTNLDLLVPAIEPYLELTNQNTGETYKGHFFRISYDMDAVASLKWFLRDWRRSEVRDIDVRLYWALAALRMAAKKDGHDGKIVVTSGYRSKKTNSSIEGAVPNSLHIDGRAVDFTVPGIPTSDLFTYIQWLGVGGVGHYPRRHFIHMDTGPEEHWVRR
ncbi:YcbK family protein [Amorphus sp. 3PC139-8]|uniref:YcbK family protein n=1 Tax=Amorphus sp. 3PC139-8 TaxID=2735676 RepID=UPI00345C8626